MQKKIWAKSGVRFAVAPYRIRPAMHGVLPFLVYLCIQPPTSHFFNSMSKYLVFRFEYLHPRIPPEDQVIKSNTAKEGRLLILFLHLFFCLRLASISRFLKSIRGDYNQQLLRVLLRAIHRFALSYSMRILCPKVCCFLPAAVFIFVASYWN